MADKKISQLTAASTPLAGTEVLPIVQNGSTVKVSVVNLTAGRAVAIAGGSFTDNITQSTAAKGINFTANTPAAGMTSQLLNWYEEGTWTPSIANSFNNYTHTIQVGRYTRIGNIVTLQFTLAWTTTNAGALTFFIEGLPFTPVTLTNYASAGSLGVINNLTNTNQIVCQVESNSAQIKFYARASGGAATALASSNWNTAGTANQVSGTIIYQV